MFHAAHYTAIRYGSRALKTAQFCNGHELVEPLRCKERKEVMVKNFALFAPFAVKIFLTTYDQCKNSAIL
jgi:hypothetical protein